DPDASPIVGTDRYDTARQLADGFVAHPDTVGVASGTTFADALAGGVTVALESGPLLLTDPNHLPATTAGYVANHTDTLTQYLAFGGPAAIAPATLDHLQTVIIHHS